MVFAQIKNLFTQARNEETLRRCSRKPVAALLVAFGLVAGSLGVPQNAKAWDYDTYDSCGNSVVVRTNLKRAHPLKECYPPSSSVWFWETRDVCNRRVIVETNLPEPRPLDQCYQKGQVVVQKLEIKNPPGTVQRYVPPAPPPPIVQQPVIVQQPRIIVPPPVVVVPRYRHPHPHLWVYPHFRVYGY